MTTHWDVHSSVGPGGMDPGVLREWSDDITRLLSSLKAHSNARILLTTGKTDVIPIFRRGKKEDPENYRLANLISVPGKAMEQILLEAISKYMKDMKVVVTGEH